MKLYTFISDGVERVGAGVGDGQVVDLFAASGDVRFNSMVSLIEAGTDGLDLCRTIVESPPVDALRSFESIMLAAPIPRPRSLRGTSTFKRHLLQSAEGAARRLSWGTPDPDATYQRIRSEMGLDKMPSPAWAKTPSYYYMDHNCVVGSDTIVQWPAYSDWIDYELELVAVIGKRGRDISPDDANRHIFGYTIINDLSARDAQLASMATGLGAAKGKDFDNSNVMGPCIVTVDEIPDPYALGCRVLVNGQEWSVSDGSEVHFRFADTLAYISQAQDIMPGDMVTTGTLPDSCSLELQRVVNKGDIIELDVEKIGTLRVKIAELT